MKVKNITIGIKSVQEGLRDLAKIVKSIQKGNPPKRKKPATYFVSLEAMRHVLTPKRLELLHMIREEQPGSIYELAQIAKRDLKNVQEDIALLAKIGLVNLKKTQLARENIIPRVDYDHLQLDIPVV